MFTYFVGTFGLIWLLAVYKVIVMDDEDFKEIKEPRSFVAIGEKVVDPDFSAHPGQVIQYTRNADGSTKKLDYIDTKKYSFVKVPITAEWLFIRSSKDYKVESRDFVKEDLHLVPHNINNGESSLRGVLDNENMDKTETKSKLKPAYLLSWPPVQPDGSIAPDEGEDTMPLIGLKVPRFWEAPPGTTDAELNVMGSKVNGEETIFLMIASYRDFQCRETITSAFSRADHPERLFVGAVDQTVPGDVGCLDLEVPCEQDDSQPICRYRSQISVYHMDAKYATGPVTARHVGDRMYRGESFVMQMDAHCQFVRHWDSKIIQQWRATNNHMAVLSTYLTDVQESLTPQGDSTRNTVPLMCNSDFEGAMPARYLRHGSQPEDIPFIKDMPQMQPFWAAGFSFSRGHFKVRVPYDAYQPMVFQGEEIAIGIRGFTFGYDFYAPLESVVFHEYAEKSNRRKKIHMFWENNLHAGEGQKSIKRGTAIIGMAPDLDPKSWDHSEMDKYGLGKVRDLQLFYKLFLIDPYKRKATQICPFAKGGFMHKDFQPYLKPDGSGIDYTQLEDYDTRAVMEKHLGHQHPLWERRLLNAIELKDSNALQKAVSSAQKFGLDKKNPALVAKALEMLQHV